MRFEFATATRIIFGPGTLQELGPLAAEMGRRVLLVTGRSASRSGPLVDLLKVLLKMRCETNEVAQKLVANTADLEQIAASDDADVLIRPVVFQH